MHIRLISSKELSLVVFQLLPIYDDAKDLSYSHITAYCMRIAVRHLDALQ